MDSVYWERQRSDQLCAVHCVNAVLQGPFYTEIDFGDIGQWIDDRERSVGLVGNQNVSMDGFFSVQVIIEALGMKGITTSYLDALSLEQGQVDPTAETALIFNRSAHWQPFRKVNGVWYDLNSCSSEPSTISEFSLASRVGGMITDKYTVLVARGTFPITNEYTCGKLEHWQRWVKVTDIRPKTALNRSQASNQRREYYSPNYSKNQPQYADFNYDKAVAMSLYDAEVELAVGKPKVDQGVFELEVLFPDGSCRRRSFHQEDTVFAVFAWLMQTTHKHYVLATFDRCPLDKNWTLEMCGLSASANVVLATEFAR